MGLNFSFSFGNNKPLSVERDLSGNWFYEIFSTKSNFKKGLSDKQKLEIILNNPAALKVFKLNCDLFTLGKVHEKNIPLSYIQTLQDKPNKHLLS